MIAVLEWLPAPHVALPARVSTLEQGALHVPALALSIYTNVLPLPILPSTRRTRVYGNILAIAAALGLAACLHSDGTSFDAAIDAAIDRCPSGWICPSQPIYSSQVGAWYTNIWRKPGDTSAPGEAFLWSISRYRPSLGFYDSNDPAVLANHLDEMKASGIDFLILDGTNGFTTTLAVDTDLLIHEELARPLVARVPIAFALGAKLWTAPSGSLTAVSAHQHEVDRVYSDFATNATNQFKYDTALNASPSIEPIEATYYRWESAPLLVVYNAWGPSANGNTWDDPRMSVRHAGAIINPTAPTTAQFGALGWWGWVTEYPQLITDDEIGVTPGADNVHRGCAACTYHLDRETGFLLEREWLRAIKANPKAIVIASWNDFVDETAIEPASPVAGSGAPTYVDSYGTEVPDWYLQIVSAYSNLRVGLMPDRVYRDEDDATMYRVTDGALVVETTKPHGQPVIPLPAGTLSGLRQTPSP
ncbi:hypothetical protein BH11MYX1_BH11MYX1_01900 [soil metagenome]